MNSEKKTLNQISQTVRYISGELGILKLFKGMLYTFLWYFSIWTGFLFVCCPLWIFLLIWPKYFLPIMSIAFSIWEMYPVALLNLIFKTKIRITGDNINSKETSIIIVNHRTRVDWNFLWALMYYGCEPRCHRMKIALKSSLRHLPSLGWVMQVANCMYLERKWKKDVIMMGKQLRYFKNTNQVFQILLFPEGTDLTKNNLRRSNQYAEKNNLEFYFNVLHPRTTGFVYLVNKMRDLDLGLTAVYDVTMVYSGLIPEREIDVIAGNFPKVVDFHVNRYPIETVPRNKEDLEMWVNERWKEKEARIDCFFKNDRTFTSIPTLTRTSDMDNALSLAFFSWTALMVWMFYLLFTNTFFLWWTILHACLFVGISCFTDGYQQLCISLHEYLSSR